MPVNGALTLADYPAAMVRLACRHCPRRGRLSRARLIAAHGADANLPQLRRTIAADCPRWDRPGETCGIYYEDL